MNWAVLLFLPQLFASQGLLFSCDAVNLILSALVFSLSGHFSLFYLTIDYADVLAASDVQNRYTPIFVYWMFLSCFTLISIILLWVLLTGERLTTSDYLCFHSVLADITRQGALASRVLFELAWLVIFWIMHLGQYDKLI